MIAKEAGLEGAAFGLFPIMWIVVNAIWIYNMTERTGHFAVLRRSFATTFGSCSFEEPIADLKALGWMSD